MEKKQHTYDFKIYNGRVKVYVALLSFLLPLHCSSDMKTFKSIAPSALPIPVRESDEPLQSGLSFFMENSEEIWKDVVGWEGMYLVSNIGRIRSLDRRVGGPKPEGRVIKGRVRRPLVVKGYLSINLIDKRTGKSTRNSIHRFVAEAFIPNPENKLCVNHINGIKTDNRIENLEWCTYQENAIHAIQTGLKKPHVVSEAQKARLREVALKHQCLKKWQENNRDRMVQFALQASLGQVKKVNQLDMNGIFIRQWSSMADASRGTTATLHGISRCTKGILKQAGGFKWELA